MSKSLVIVESPAKAKTIKKYLGKDFSVEASSGHLIDLPNNKLGVNIEKNFKPEYVVIKNKKKFLDQLEKASKKADNIYLASAPDREGEAIAWHIVDGLKIKDKAYGALRLVVEREREVENFKSDEYWTIEAELKQLLDDAISFVAVLSKYDGEKVDIKTEEAASRVDAVQVLPRDVHEPRQAGPRPQAEPPPFITSTLQQEASRKLRFPVKKTMTIAQKLYEGVELGDEGPAGLITYMRTDSVRVSEHAINEARGYIGEAYGADFLPEGPNIFKVKKSAQDAHEAIRPTSVIKSPDSVKIYLSEDEFELYKLIWQRFISCQMNPALYDQTTVEIEAGKGLFRATGSVIKFPGFTIVYMEGKEEEEEAKEKEEEKRLPDLSEGEDLKLIALEGKQHFTQPPPRFTESALVKELEERGIGRPSTYATILSTIQDREYVIKEKNRLKPTLLGCAITDLLIEGFPEVMDVQFTAEMEEKLDEVEEGSVNWVELLNDFYKGFGKRVKRPQVFLRAMRCEGMPTELDCEQCGGQMIVKWGKRGEFLSCSKYPECKNAKQFEYGEDGEIRIKEKKEPEIRHDILCDLCGKPMVVRKSRYGKFLGCTSYPECKAIKRLKDVQGEGVDKVKESGESTEENKKESKRKSFRKSPAKKKAEEKSQAKGYQA